MVEIEYRLIDKNYTFAKNRQIKYIVVHYTAGVTSKIGSARNTANWFNNPNAHASAHYIVDDGSIVQAVSDDCIAWHCGDGHLHPECTNSNSIGIEICSSHDNFKGYDKTFASDPGWYFTDAVKNNAADLVASLMQKYKIPIYNVIRHYDVSGKDCPSIWVDDNKEGYSGFEKFIKMVRDKMNNIDRFNKLDECPIWSKEGLKWYIDKGYLKGDENGNLNLTEDMIRNLIVAYRTLKGEGLING